MVQLPNPDRLSQIIDFGTIKDGEDVNGMPTSDFVQIGKPTLCGRWGLSTNQLIQMSGLDQNQSVIVVVHHRENWLGITHARFNNELYQVANINPDPYRNPTAYDLITLKKVSGANG